jgi:hypothetical protein
MGFLRTAVKGAVAGKAIQLARREANRPSNQRKAKDLFSRVTRRGRSTSARGR